MHNFNGKKSNGLSIAARLAWIIVAVTAIVLVVLFIKAKTKPKDPDAIIDIYSTEVPSSTPVSSETPDVQTSGTISDSAVPSETPSSTPAPSETPAITTAAPSPGDLDYSVFDNCAFVGNSVFEGLYRYGVITRGKFFTKVGLNILSVYTDTTATGTVPIIDELDTGSYESVILMFGQNELGWPSVDSFIQHYSDFIDDVRAKQPNARIFLTGLPPFSKEKSAEGGSTGLTNERVHLYNGRIEELAQSKNCYYISVPDAMMDADGALPSEATSDGIHLNLTYSKIWADHICLTVMVAHGR